MTSEQIADATRQFLQAGGCIVQVASGASGISQLGGKRTQKEVRDETKNGSRRGQVESCICGGAK